MSSLEQGSSKSVPWTTWVAHQKDPPSWGSDSVRPGICTFNSSPFPWNDNFLELIIYATNHSWLLSTGQSTKIRYYSPFTCLSPPFPGAHNVVVVAYSQSALWLQKRSEDFGFGGMREASQKRWFWFVSLSLNRNLLLREWLEKVTFQEEEMECAMTLCINVPERLSHLMCLENRGHGGWCWKMPNYLNYYSLKNCSSLLKCFNEKLLTTFCIVFPPTHQCSFS